MADTNNTECCNSCRFFSTGDRMGTCRRYPENKNKSHNDWCGEFLLSQHSPSLEDLVKAIIEPVVLTEPKKQRGRPKK